MNIDNLLIKKGVTKAMLAERMGILPQNVNANLKNPKEDTIRNIADALGVEPWELFATKEEIIKEDENTITCPTCGTKIEFKKKEEE